MTKRIIFFTTTSLVVFFTSYFLHNYYIGSSGISLAFSLFEVYLFQIIATIIVYTASKIALIKLPNEAGYLFLFLTMVQSAIFFLVFKNYIFSENPLSRTEKFSFIIPMFLSLILEATAVVKLLNKKEYGEKLT